MGTVNVFATSWLEYTLEMASSRPTGRDRDPIRVAFRGVQPEYRQVGSPILRLLSEASGRRLLPVNFSNQSPDLVFVSSHNAMRRRVVNAVGVRLSRVLSSRGIVRTQCGSGVQSSSQPYRLWYSGEAERPPAGSWDLTLSSQVDEMEGRNVYFPVWFDTVGLLGPPTVRFTEGIVTPELFAQPRELVEIDRPGFVCAFIGRWTRERQVAVQMLNEIGTVEVFGSAVGRPVLSKNQIAASYRYVLCFENTLLPGYVTEKPFDAWQVGAIPLWSGLDPAGFVNPAAVVNAADFERLRDFVDFVRTLEGNPQRRAAMLTQPLLTQMPSLTSIIGKVRRALSSHRLRTGNTMVAHPRHWTPS